MGNNMANPEDYQTVISALGTFETAITDCCTGMNSAAQECVDNLNGDQHAAKRAGEVQQSAAAIQKHLEGISEIAQKMQQQLNDIYAAGND